MLFDDIDANIQEIITKGDFAKKQSNKELKFTSLWRNEFAPSGHIGHTNRLLRKYGIMRVNGDFNHKLVEFIKDYLDDPDPTFNKNTWMGSCGHGRSVQQVECLANHISDRCNEENITFSDGMENDIERLMCLIINHACTETLAGKYSELLVEEYFNSFGYRRDNQTDVPDSLWDSNGVDILLYNGDKIFRFVQVKPQSFLLGDKPDLCKDRKKCIDDNQAYVDEYLQLHYLEAHPNIRPEIIYCFYDRRHKFINFKGENSDNGVFITYGDFANDDGTPKYNSTQLLKLPTVYLTNFKKKVF